MKRTFWLSLLCLALLDGRPFLQAPAAGATAASPQTVTPAREQAYRANNVGVAALEQFNYQDAERSFREALRLAPDLALARLNLAIALLYAGQPADAVAEARAAAGPLAELPQAHYVLGLAARADDKPAEAVAAFERVLQLDPDDAATKVQLGQIHLQGRRYEEAVRLFADALAAEPYNVTAAYNVALASTRAGRADEGRTAMQRFETLRDSPYGVTYAQTYLSQGRYAEAVASTGAEPDLIDPAVPDVTFSVAPVGARPPTAGQAAAGQAAAGQAAAGGALTLFDADGDGDLDLLDVGAGGLRFLRNENGAFSDATKAAGLAFSPDGSLAGAVAGDADNDGRPDLFVLGSRAGRLFHQRADGTFEDRTAQAALPPPPGAAATAAFADLDHDGDLDLVIAGTSVQLLQNNGTGVFTDISAKAGVGGAVAARAVAPTDYDNRRDIDLLVLGRERLFVYRNMRNGTFRESAADVGLAAAPDQAGDLHALAVGDVNKDGYPDIFIGGGAAAGVLALSDGQTRFRVTAAPPAAAGARAAQFVDYDNDGVLDLLALAPGGPRLFRNGGDGRWTDVTERAQLPAAAPDGPDGAARAMRASMSWARFNQADSACCSACRNGASASGPPCAAALDV
jgi:tetratricopeptide (TPR) repeat protein